MSVDEHNERASGSASGVNSDCGGTEQSSADQAHELAWDVFAGADANGDGLLSRTELHNYLQEHPDEAQSLVGATGAHASVEASLAAWHFLPPLALSRSAMPRLSADRPVGLVLVPPYARRCAGAARATANRLTNDVSCVPPPAPARPRAMQLFMESIFRRDVSGSPRRPPWPGPPVRAASRSSTPRAGSPRERSLF